MIQSNGTLSLNDLIASRREGHSMPQEFYTADAQHHYETYYFLGH